MVKRGKRNSKKNLTRENVFVCLRKANRPLALNELAETIGADCVNDLAYLLEEMETDGEVIRTRKNRYGLPDKMNLLIGVIQGNAKGFAFFIPDDKDLDDIYISKESLNGAMHKDRVIVRPLAAGLRGKRNEGEVIRILKRANRRVVGTFEEGGRHFGMVIPDEKRLGWDIFIPRAQNKKARSGDKVIVEITSWPEARRSPEGRIIEFFGKTGEPGVDILSIIKKYNLPEEFPEGALDEAAAVPMQLTPEDLEGRWDLRHLQLVTIDGEDAKDLDDAVSLEVLDDGNYLLGVHIADVSYYVRQGSELDKEALRRGTSVYLVDRVIPMLPPRLSNGICSLNAGEERLAMTVFMEVTRKGRVASYEIGPSIIKVSERMTYTNVRLLLEERDDLLNKRYAAFFELFQQMRELCQILRQRRWQRGALDFDFPESKVTLDEHGRPLSVLLLEQSIANQIIEEFMLLANETVAQHLYQAKTPLLFRVHERPRVEKITQLNEFLHGFGYHLPCDDRINPRHFQEILQKTKGQPEELVISTVMLRSLQHARYASQSLGHFGLALQLYTHFTSPIRRYPDLVIHRILRELIKSNGDLSVRRKAKLDEMLEAYAEKCSERELIAEEAERETVDLKKVEYMRQFLGEVFDGLIVSITNFGMFIALDSGIEGLVHVSTITDDYYYFNERNYTLIGENTGKVFHIGDQVKVRLLRASMEDRQIHFELT